MWLVKHGISDFCKTICETSWCLWYLPTAKLTLAPDFIKGGRAMHSVFATIDRQTKLEPDDVAAAAVPGPSVSNV